MQSMTAPADPVTVGVDTHRDVHVAAVVDQTGRLLATEAFPASTRGYVGLVTWAERFGLVARIGVEGDRHLWGRPGPLRARLRPRGGRG